MQPFSCISARGRLICNQEVAPVILTDLSRIEKKILIRAPRSRVWRAITDVAEFSIWFSVMAEGEFAPGARLRMTSTHELGHGAVFSVVIEHMEPERLFSWRWHPGSPKSDVDYSRELATLVSFHLDEVAEGTLLTLIESGFDQISLKRRAAVYKENSEGWEIQTLSLQSYVGKSS